MNGVYMQVWPALRTCQYESMTMKVLTHLSMSRGFMRDWAKPLGKWMVSSDFNRSVLIRLSYTSRMLQGR